VIAGFGDKATEDIHDVNSARARRFSEEVRKVARRKLMLVAAATTVQDLRVPPGNRLEQLRGDMAGRWSVRVNDQWRIVFRWADGTASEVRLTDYH
jgi:toxin HigB-1